MPTDPMPIWLRSEQPARGPQPSYSRAQIVRAAIEIADAEGIDAVSMRRVAAEVGAGTMSLYRYVPKKDDLYELMADAVTGEEPTPTPSGDWRADLRLLAHRQRATALRHPWTVSLGLRPSFGPNSLRNIEFMGSVLGRLGLDIDTVLQMSGIVMSFVLGTVRQELAGQEARRRTGMDEEEWRRMYGPYIRKLIDSGEHPHFAKIIIDAETPHTDAGTQFARSLDRLLDGLAAGLPQPADPAR